MVANPNPHKARQKRKRRPTPGTVKQLTAVLWSAITKLEEHLSVTADAEEVNTAELCKLTHALSQSAGSYLRAVEVGELEARVEALEGALERNPVLKRAA